ncbi:hypothetical protein X777_01464 [Ooceraea biroi]|uniref:GIY-YIG domain-containing protein n=1 Tax=Ooceraea biroi TaxID=2015173 RepID=A0A026WQ36_OOCBI|nr:hypothetical protein X777_01464 [Ooceraea biroi]
MLLADVRFHTSNLNLVKSLLVNTCFPDFFINKHINRRIQTLCKKSGDANRIDDNVDNNTFNRILIPYVRGSGESLERILRSVELFVVNTVPKKLNLLIGRGKDKIEIGHRTGIVHKLDCKDCDLCYIGQTKRYLDTRINEHRAGIKKHSGNLSVVSNHRLTNDHDFDWSKRNILHYESNNRKREIAEMFCVKKNPKTINLKRDTENLSDVYDGIVTNT